VTVTDSKALAVRDEQKDFGELMKVGAMIAKSGYFQDAREESQAIVKVLAGKELGIGPVTAMQGIYIVKGRVTLGANLMASLIKSSGRYNYRILELTDKVCRIQFYEDGKPVGESSFTMEDAKKAGLGGANWTGYARNMLFARALSNGAKWYCPDAFSGTTPYTREEIEQGATVEELPTVEVDTATGEVIEGEVVDQKPVDPSRQKIIDAIETDWKKRTEYDPAFGTAPRRFNSIKGWVNANGSTPWDEKYDAKSVKAEAIDEWLRWAFIDDLIDYGKHNRARLRTEKADAAREAEQSMSDADGSEGAEVDE
jgi:hypothetical protein